MRTIAHEQAAVCLYFVVVLGIGATWNWLFTLLFTVIAVGLVQRLPLETFPGLALILVGALAVVDHALENPNLSASFDPETEERMNFLDGSHRN